MTSEEIKESVFMRDVLQRCGLPVPNRAGFIQCPFHKGDRTPSMKIYQKDYHCFACGANGDVFTFCRNMRVSRSGKHFWNWAGSTRTGRMNVGLPASVGDMNFKSGGRKRRERFVRKRKRRRHCVRKQSSCGYVCACLNRFRMHGVNVTTGFNWQNTDWNI